MAGFRLEEEETIFLKQNISSSEKYGVETSISIQMCQINTIFLYPHMDTQ